jgi:hypothetical protein
MKIKKKNDKKNAKVMQNNAKINIPTSKNNYGRKNNGKK